ncbi:hypothetical protein M427DRAFT_130252 [Gonapodya prolifera JEL478]|uniref:Uncharacterized protein n=1 Tax=Gonapodya prolifera (strain JEL478) TaxID=1344416 RepID=A0A139AXI9_GONPJ|nr:hypothetical protein M427DRAFT_130252 [Gonapodya prolifera JEL478]|eukprot:KXS21461.1 hypothetical protein M427DRAFT_130252 [Gonapodya prolifera JEL478]
MPRSPTSTTDSMDLDAEDPSDTATAFNEASSTTAEDSATFTPGDDGSSTTRGSAESRSSTPSSAPNGGATVADQLSREARRSKLFEILSKAGTYISILTTSRPLSMEANAQKVMEDREKEKERREKEAAERAERVKTKEAEMADALKNRRKGTRGKSTTNVEEVSLASQESSAAKPPSTGSKSSSRGRKRKSTTEDPSQQSLDDDAQAEVYSSGKSNTILEAKTPEQKAATSSNSAKRTKSDHPSPSPSTPTSVALLEPLQPRQPRFVQGALLRDYQLDGVEWLQMIWENGLNGILADEMGLGKTIQTISFLAWMKEKIPTAGPFLVVAPLSVIDNWVDEVKRFTPTLPVLRYHGTPPERAELREKVILRAKSTEKPIVVTSYDIILNDRKYFQNLTWYYTVVDEGHRIKNMNCKLIRELKQLRTANRLLLTGTPLQNNLAELWSLLNFILPEIFDSYDQFLAWFDIEENLHGDNDGGAAGILEKEEREGVVSNLHTLLRPFMLRRCKTDVETTLPPKKEYIVYAPLVPTQRRLYTACLEGPGGLREMLGKLVSGKESEQTGRSTGDVNDEADAESFSEEETVPLALRRKARESSKWLVSTGRYDVDSIPDEDLDDELAKTADATAARQNAQESARALKKVATPSSKKSLNSVIIQLRKVCQHPFLFPDLWDKAMQEESDTDATSMSPSLSRSVQKKGKKVKPPLPGIVAQSGKMYLLERMLPKLFENGHKVLIFSQWVEVLNILEEYCVEYRGWKVCRLDGSTKLEERKSQMKEFNTNPDIKIFLLSTRAGGLGINLVSADTVIIYDSDWNPQADLQAQDRAHRIGQTKPVVVYRLVTENTVEAKILQKARAKRKLEKLVMKDGMFRDIKKNSDRSSILTDIAELLMKSDQETISSDLQQELLTPENILPNDVLQKIMRRDGESSGEKEDSARFEEVDDEDDD